MKKIKKKVVSKVLKLAANNSTANKIANRQLKKYAKKSDSRIVHLVAENHKANKAANKLLKVVANNKTAYNLAWKVIEKKFD